MRRLDEQLNADQSALVRQTENRLKEMRSRQQTPESRPLSSRGAGRPGLSLGGMVGMGGDDAAPRNASGAGTPGQGGYTEAQQRLPLEDDQGSYVEDEDGQEEQEEQEGQGNTAINDALRLSLQQDDAEEEAVLGSMSAAATIRYQKAKMKVLQEGLEKMSEENRLHEKKVNSLTATNKKLTADAKKFDSQMKNISVENEKNKKSLLGKDDRVKELTAQLAQCKKETQSSGRGLNKVEAERQATEVRLNRALEEVDRYKNLWAESKDHVKASSGVGKKELSRLQGDVKRLNAQKLELLAAFKKQLKLIDVLKRQKMHVEAARMLGFTEEEFAKTLEVDDV